MTNIKKLPNIYKLNDYTQYIICRYTQDNLSSNELYSLIIHVHSLLVKATYSVELKTFTSVIQAMIKVERKYRKDKE